jgi:selenocysteine lyase/cysteine desulfurase
VLATKYTYLNTGSLGPAPRRVLDTLHTLIDELESNVDTGRNWIVESRERVARFLGADPAEIAFTRNATEGNATIASGLRLCRGDEVIFESHAHAGGAIPWMVRQKVDGIRVRVFEPDPDSAAGNVDRIATLVTRRTRAIQVSHITAPTGLVMPVAQIAALAREQDIWFHVDGAQSAGQIPIDLHAMGCHSYATSCHKWVGAPHGTGVLFVRQDRLDDITPTDVGAHAHLKYEIPDVFEFHPSAQRYECGTRDAPHVRATFEAVRFLEDIGMERVAAYGRRLALRLRDKLAEIPALVLLTPSAAQLSASMTSFRVQGLKGSDLYNYLLQEHRIRCRYVPERRLDAVRVSTHLFNSSAECDRLAEAVALGVRRLGS